MASSSVRCTSNLSQPSDGRRGESSVPGRPRCTCRRVAGPRRHDCCAEPEKRGHLAGRRRRSLLDRRFGQTHVPPRVECVAAFIQAVHILDGEGVPAVGWCAIYKVLYDNRKPEIPLVTIAVVCFNQASYIAESLDSIAAQKFSDFEILFFDDASTDASVDAALEWLSQARVSALLARNDINYGLVPTLAAELTLVRTEFVSFLAADDALEPEKLSDQVPRLLASPSRVGFVYSDAYLMSEEGWLDGSTWLGDHFPTRTTRRSGDLFPEIIARRFRLPAMTILTRTELLRSLGVFGPGLTYEDLDLDLRLSHASIGLFSEYISARYRLRPAGLRNTLGQESLLKSDMQVYRAWLHSPRATRRIARREYIILACLLYELRAMTRSNLLKAAIMTRSLTAVLVALLCVGVPLEFLRWVRRRLRPRAGRLDRVRARDVTNYGQLAVQHNSTVSYAGEDLEGPLRDD